MPRLVACLGGGRQRAGAMPRLPARWGALLLCAAPLVADAASQKPWGPKSLDGALTFFGFADWGGMQLPPFTTTAQLQDAVAMGDLAEIPGHEPAFMIAAGDNFYQDGLPGAATDPEVIERFKFTYADVYTAPGLQIPWYLIAGNHDWVGNVTAQVALNGTALSNGRWYFPSLYYTFTKTIPGTGETVEFVMIDTETLTGGVNPMPSDIPYEELMPIAHPPPPKPRSWPWAHQRRAGRRLANKRDRAAAEAPEGAQRISEMAEWEQGDEADVKDDIGDQHSGSHDVSSSDVPAGWVPPPVDEVQWTWVEDTLANSTADWLVVVGHHPVWSVGKLGPTWDLVKRLMPMLDQYGVALYLSGHEHMLEHIRIPQRNLSSVDFVVMGAGAYVQASDDDHDHFKYCPEGSLRFEYDKGAGFAQFKFTPASEQFGPSQVSVTYYDYLLNQLYKFHKLNPRAQPSGPRPPRPPRPPPRPPRPPPRPPPPPPPPPPPTFAALWPPAPPVPPVPVAPAGVASTGEASSEVTGEASSEVGVVQATATGDDELGAPAQGSSLTGGRIARVMSACLFLGGAVGMLAQVALRQERRRSEPPEQRSAL